MTPFPLSRIRAVEPSWRDFGILWILAIALALGYWPTTKSLAALWTDHPSVYQWNGWVVVLLATWFLARRRHSIALTYSRPSPAAATALAVATAVWLLAYAASFQVIHEALLPAIIGLAIYAAFGPEVGRQCAFPLGYLLLGIPVWDFLLKPLQFLTVKLAGGLVGLFGVPAYIHGAFVQIPEGTFHVEGGCAGLGYFVTGLMVAALIGELERASTRIRFVLLLVGAAFAIMGNWVRVAGVILIGHLSDMQSPIVHDHKLFGELIFGAVVVLFALVSGWLRHPEGGAPRSGLKLESRGSTQPRGTRLTPRAVLVLLVAAVAPVWSAAIDARLPASVPHSLLRAAAAPWVGPDKPSTDWRPHFRDATSEQLATYQDSDGRVEVYVAAYAKQTQAAKLLGYYNSVLGVTDARIVARARISVRQQPMNELEVQTSPEGPAGDSRHWLVWYAYEIGNRVFASPLVAQSWYAAASLVGVESSRAVVLRAGCSTDCSRARKQLKNFVTLDEWLFGTRN